MTKRCSHLQSMCAFFSFIVFFVASLCHASGVGQTIQIYTHLDKIIGTPSWLIIIHDADSSAVYPYLYDLVDTDNYFLIFTHSKNYRIVSELQFDAHHKIHHFCRLPQGIISQESMYITLKGTLSAHPSTSECYITKYKDIPYTVNIGGS